MITPLPVAAPPSEKRTTHGCQASFQNTFPPRLRKGVHNPER